MQIEYLAEIQYCLIMQIDDLFIACTPETGFPDGLAPPCILFLFLAFLFLQ